MSKGFIVIWRCELDAENEIAAAEEALDMIKNSDARVFQVLEIESENDRDETDRIIREEKIRQLDQALDRWALVDLG